MAINLSDNIKVRAPKPADSRYLNITVPYVSIAEVNSIIPIGERHPGLTVNINGIEYWYKSDVGDGDLIIKSAGTISGATNGLTVSNNVVSLGGTLTGNTKICSDLYNLDIISNVLSLSGISTSLVGNDVTIGNNSNFIGLVCGGCAIISNSDNTYDSSVVLSTNCITLSSNISTTSTGLTMSIGNNNVDITSYNPAFEGVKYGYDYSNFYTARSLVDAAYVTGKTAAIGIAITGATNGLNKYNSNNVCLGGTLTSPVIICGTQSLTLGDLNSINLSTTNSCDISLNSKLAGGIYLKSQSGTTCTNSDYTNAIGIVADYDSSGGFKIIDNRIGVNQTGIVYDNDYSLNYVARSLVDRGYVDSIATGLNVHAAVRVATTTGITLSGLSTVDGILLNTGDRVLVKNQSLAWQNGIYSASTGVWGRPSDYNFNPSGEIGNGDLIPVLTGNTNAFTIWVLVTLNPIVSGDSLQYSLFTKQLSIIGGNGIDISQSGSNQQISVKLSPTNPGLIFDGNALELDYNIFRYGLCCNNGRIDVRTTHSAAVGTEVGVKINTGGTNTLFVDSTDINTALGNPIINANNGLCKKGNTVVLGGALTGNTTICGGFNLNVCGNTKLNTQCGLQISGVTMFDTTRNSLSNIRIGCQALNSNTIGINNTAIGYQSLSANTTGCNNNAFGCQALSRNTTACNNIAFGYRTLYSNTIGCNNIANGYFALQSSTCGNNNIANGYWALVNNTCACNNIAFGYKSLSGITIGSGNIGIGNLSFAKTNGCNNIAIGEQVASNSGGCYGINIGYQAGYCNVGSYSIAIGYQALYNSIASNDIIAIGRRTQYNTIISACDIIAIGNNALCGNTQSINIGIGTNVLMNNSGVGNIGIGGWSLLSNTSGCENIGIGTFSMSSNSIGSCNISIGAFSLCTNDGNNNIAFGSCTLCTNTTGSRNIGIGTLAGYCNITGNSNVFIGNCAGYSETTSNKLHISYNGVCDLISGDFVQNCVVLPTLKLCVTPANGACTDSVLTWNSSTCQVRMLPYSSGGTGGGGDKNNRLNVCVLTSSSTLNPTGYTYLINSVSANTQTLPSIPVDGAAYVIKDASGNALTNNIIVAGNGKNIDGSATATINTNYGGLTLTYSSALNSWYILSFVS